MVVVSPGHSDGRPSSPCRRGPRQDPGVSVALCATGWSRSLRKAWWPSGSVDVEGLRSGVIPQCRSLGPSPWSRRWKESLWGAWVGPSPHLFPTAYVTPMVAGTRSTCTACFGVSVWAGGWGLGRGRASRFLSKGVHHLSLFLTQVPWPG